MTSGQKRGIICITGMKYAASGGKHGAFDRQTDSKPAGDREQIVKVCMADGIDPETGEILPEDSVCNQPEVIRALHFALDCLSHQKQRRNTSIFYVNQGKAWTAEEESLLTRLFRKGESNAQIQMELQRSESAVSARLVRLGLIEHREDYRARDKKHSENNFPY